MKLFVHLNGEGSHTYNHFCNLHFYKIKICLFDCLLVLHLSYIYIYMTIIAIIAMAADKTVTFYKRDTSTDIPTLITLKPPA